MSHELYISDWCRKAGYIPENDYDPRYYDIGSALDYEYKDYDGITKVIEDVHDKFGADSYELICFDEVVYTENYDVMRYLQDDILIAPMWFDVCGDDVNTVDELHKSGWTW